MVFKIFNDVVVDGKKVYNKFGEEVKVRLENKVGNILRQLLEEAEACFAAGGTDFIVQAYPGSLDKAMTVFKILKSKIPELVVTLGEDQLGKFQLEFTINSVMKLPTAVELRKERVTPPEQH